MTTTASRQPPRQLGVVGVLTVPLVRPGERASVARRRQPRGGDVRRASCKLRIFRAARPRLDPTRRRTA